MNTQNLAFLYLPDLLGPDFPYYWNYKADYRGTSNVASLKFSTNVTPAVNLEAQLKYNRSDFDGSTAYLDGSLFQPPAGTVDTTKYIDQKVGFTVKGAYRPGESFSLVSGVDYYRIKADFSRFIASQPVIYVDSVAPFVNAEYRIGGFGLHAGARYDYDSSFGHQLSPSVGATFNFLKASLFRVNVARTFKVPPLWYTLGVSYFDQILPNPDLKPERAWAYSAGFETQELRYVYLKLSGYYHKMTDGIVRVPADIEGRFTWGNISEFIRKGYEAELGVLAPFGLTGYLGTNYNKHENTTGGEAVILTWIPTRTYKAGLKYKNDKFDFFANLRARWIWWNMDQELSSLFVPHDKKWVVDLRVSKGFNLAGSTRLGIFLDVFNLTDQIYWDRSDFPNPRRWVQLGLELNLK
jgi:outer membrane receptor protein involved in Fe transport